MTNMTRYMAPVLALLLLVVVSGCATGPTQSAVSHEQPVRQDKVVLAVRTSNHLEVAMLTARQMLAGEGSFTASRVDIVACGEAVVALTEGTRTADAVTQTLASGTRVVACGITLERKGIDPSTLLTGVEVVPNGLTEIIRLQSLGFYSVEL